MLYLGIDQHARQITISLRDEDGDVLQARQVSTQPEKIQAFFQQLTRERLRNDESFVAVLEVCGPEDINLVELHDCFATAEILHYENLGLCGEGEAGRMIDEGEVALGGRVPVNVSGGLLSKGHPLGATGIANIYEVSTHLRGEAGKRQVDGARLGMTHVIGLGSACAIHILERV